MDYLFDWLPADWQCGRKLPAASTSGRFRYWAAASGIGRIALRRKRIHQRRRLRVKNHSTISQQLNVFVIDLLIINYQVTVALLRSFTNWISQSINFGQLMKLFPFDEWTGSGFRKLELRCTPDGCNPPITILPRPLPPLFRTRRLTATCIRSTPVCSSAFFWFLPPPTPTSPPPPALPPSSTLHRLGRSE